MRRPLIFASIAFALLVVATGCGSSSGSSSSSTTAASTAKTGEVSPTGDIPDTQAFVGFTAPSGIYTITVPEGWAQSTAGTKVTFTSHFNTVSVETGTSASAPTAASVRTVDLPSLQLDSGFRLVSVKTEPRTAGRATVVTYQVESAPDPVTGKRIALDAQRYQFWRNGQLVTITLTAPKGSDNVDAWKTITNSFAWSQ
jgi:hypothetical protein